MKSRIFFLDFMGQPKMMMSNYLSVSLSNLSEHVQWSVADLGEHPGFDPLQNFSRLHAVNPEKTPKYIVHLPLEILDPPLMVLHSSRKNL